MPEIRVFPLNTVLFPGGQLPLRIFETRYLDMVSRCLRECQGFGVCLIKEGGEAGPAKFHGVGTLAEIGDWSRGDDGLLQILARGTRRFRLTASRVQADGLNVGDLEWLSEEPPVTVPESRRPLAELLRQIMAQLPVENVATEEQYSDARWVGYRLSEFLPLGLAQRQYLLELSDPEKRLDILVTLLQSLSTA
ncbi:MAG: LON peptidase substrate-binding domain-containing protein [Bacillota bacterium]